VVSRKKQAVSSGQAICKNSVRTGPQIVICIQISSWIDAWNFCCKLDMRLVTVASLAKIKLLAGMATGKNVNLVMENI
jgi:hypothetical protein